MSLRIPFLDLLIFLSNPYPNIFVIFWYYVYFLKAKNRNPYPNYKKIRYLSQSYYPFILSFWKISFKAFQIWVSFQRVD